MKPSTFLRCLAGCLLFCAASVHAATCADATIPANNPDSIYTDNGNGTVTDTSTGLMWKKCSEGQTWSGTACTGTASNFSWSNALSRSATANFAGHTDWRLPNIKELSSLLEGCRIAPTINNSLFPGTPSEAFWSGSPYVGDLGSAWLVDFGFGFVGNGNHSYSNAVRLVREGKTAADTFDAGSISDARVFAYAEANYSNIFAGYPAEGQYLQYHYRYYPESQNYLAVSTSGEIFILGPVLTGNVITSVGFVENYRSYITAWEAAH